MYNVICYHCIDSKLAFLFFVLLQIHVANVLFKYYGNLGGIPTVKWSGVDGEDNILVIDLLGPSLEDLFVYCGRKFSLKTVLMLADQMVRTYFWLYIDDETEIITKSF